MNFKKLNFKQPKYIIPLILLPLLLLLVYQGTQYMKINDSKGVAKQDLSLSLGETQDSILSKNAAYDHLYQNSNSRTMLDGIANDEDSLQQYSDHLDDQQKRYIDSLQITRSMTGKANLNNQKKYYQQKSHLNSDDKDFQRSAEMIRMLNNTSSSSYNEPAEPNTLTEEKHSKASENDVDPVKMLRRQMLMMDSLEKAKDPEYQSALVAENKLKKNKEKLDAFINATLRVHKTSLNPEFNSISKKTESKFIKAVIDENVNGYLGSRIRLRLLEDIVVERFKLTKGSLMYAQISGFDLQRVNLSITSIFYNGEILPINLSVFDLDGMQGLYIPQSDFREMLRELGTNSVQGTQLDSSGEGFFTSMLSGVLSSTSKTISNIIRKNKAKLKYNSYLLLINDKELRK